MKIFETTFGYEVHEFELKHLPPIWGIIKDAKMFFADNEKWATENVTNFAIWWFRYIKIAFVIIKDKKVVGCFYGTDLKPQHWVNAHVYFAHGHRKPENTFILTQFLLGVTFYKYGLKKIQSMVTTKLPGRLRYSERMGFLIDGISRAYKFRNGEWEDYIVSSMLREEYENLHKISDRHGVSEGS